MKMSTGCSCEESVNGSPCWVVESIPLEDDAVYSKTISWIRQDALIPVKVEFFMTGWASC
jgi:hypothetical protein